MSVSGIAAGPSNRRLFMLPKLLGAGVGVTLATGLLVVGHCCFGWASVFGYPFPWREALNYFGTSTISWPFFLVDSLFYTAAGYLILIAYRLKLGLSEINHPGLFMLTVLYAGLTIAFSTILFFL